MKREDLSGYIDGELSDAQRIQVERALTDEDAEKLQTYKQITESVSEAPKPPQSFTSSVMQYVIQQTESVNNVPIKHKHTFARFVPVAAGLVLVVGIALFANSFLFGNDKSANAPQLPPEYATANTSESDYESSLDKGIVTGAGTEEGASFDYANAGSSTDEYSTDSVADEPKPVAPQATSVPEAAPAEAATPADDAKTDTPESPAAAAPAPPANIEIADANAQFYAIIYVTGELPPALSSYPLEPSERGDAELQIPREVADELAALGYETVSVNPDSETALVIYSK
ncbi:MAG: hypothetical protein LBN30_00670 [Oscillospiraceae bacterium]|nr:hypothetical protein [Oscillospiraceae bacterium]